MTLEFSRDDASSRYLALENGEQLGLIDFDTGPDSIVITHTETEPAARGRGIAGQLTRFAVDDIRGRDLQVVPACPFTKAWFDSHPDDQDLLAQP